MNNNIKLTGGVEMAATLQTPSRQSIKRELGCAIVAISPALLSDRSRPHDR